MFSYWKLCILFVGVTAVLVTACTGTSEPEPIIPTPIVANQTAVPVVEDPTPTPTAAAIAEEPTTVPVEEAPIPQNDPIRVQFDPGTTSATLAGNLVKGEVQTYLLGAQEGQTLTAVFTSPNNSQATMSLAINGESIVDNQPHAAAVLPQTGDYALSVHGRDAAAPYTYQFTVEISAFAPGPGLPVQHPTFADRATWLEFLGAPAECNLVDSQLEAQDRLGITFYPVSDSQYLLQVVCETFAYSAHDRLYLHDIVQNSSTQLLVPEFDPQANAVVNRDILWGSGFVFDDVTRQFTNFQKGRGLGDCGALNTYEFANSQLTLLESRQQDCVDGQTAVPPAEWPVVYSTN